MLVELYQVNTMPEKAYESIQRMQGVDAGSPMECLLLQNIIAAQIRKEKSFEQLKLAFAHKELETRSETKIITNTCHL
ncbi:MAG: hypothetical protein IPL22_09290 [Bacteroidetes bacterium]|nr:hypothetical protein [Bacteroidota bacterium]